MCAPIEYVALVVGQRHFACTPLHATLDTGACADRWQRAMKPDAERFILCRRCPIGRQHYAEHHPEQQNAVKQPERASVCVRCGRPAARMIGKIHCPSCWNREAEWRKGRNARGNTPIAYRQPLPRRVGIAGNDGAPAWVLFDGQHQAEAMARATRAGLRLNDAQPGRTYWNAERQTFEYRDEAGHVLIEMEIDGKVEYVAVEQLHQGEQPASVRMPTQLLTAEEAACWLEVSGEGDELGADPHQTEFGCSKCQKAMLHAHRRHGQIIVLCSAGCC